MTRLIEPKTPRLRLRQWRESDLAPFAALNADPEVMAHFPALLSRAESDALAERIRERIAERGWGFWAVEAKAETSLQASFIGFVGLHIPRDDLPFAPCVEIGWRLARPYWGHGYAREAAEAALAVAFDSLGLDEVVSFTSLDNHRSQAVMRRLGMRRAETFEHPALPPSHPLCLHCLYRLSAADWRIATPLYP
ncbi:GNAT family N-acetyltransferase [Halomonas sp. 328]|uniref:GNAT family N-acetyltransferase n=1 Tax=Halomonas sp. 328 TaxID=2776704 RepID=UPI0018A70DE4|nr:GNAT family N-acetyltransferase [Halomonas sp. 328]MBF8223351.1 GNAT family N-acetyltransferase [Halomonas sp. 328]